MLSEQDKQDILAELAHYPQKRAASPDALKVVQRRFGFVSDEHIAELAGLLEMTAEELDEVATFYSLIYRRPVGRHVILICDSVTCWIMGYPLLRDHLLSRLGIDGMGQTSPDGRFTLLPVPCLGVCDHAPALMIDQDLYGDLTPERIDQALEKYK